MWLSIEARIATQGFERYVFSRVRVLYCAESADLRSQLLF